jgi:hypothetical protein
MTKQKKQSVLSANGRRRTIQEMQDKIFKKMSVDKKIKLAFDLNRLIKRIAEDSVKEQYPEANNVFIDNKLRERMK